MRRAVVIVLALLAPAAAPTATAVAARERLDDVSLRLSSTGLVLSEASLDGSIEVHESAESVQVLLAVDVLFAPEQTRLEPDADPRISELVDRVEAAVPRVVHVVGSPVPRGSPAGLSRRQAASVAQALRAGLAGTVPRIRVTGANEVLPRSAEGQVRVTFAA